MAINQNGIDLIKHFEGLFLKAYKDPVGIWTIGWGHTGPDVSKGLVINADKAEALLAEDLLEHEDAVDDLVTVSLNGDQKAALVSFAFNAGNNNLKGSTLLRKLNEGDYAAAAKQFDRWIYGTVNGEKKELKGLVRRRNAERQLFLGEYTGVVFSKMIVSAVMPNIEKAIQSKDIDNSILEGDYDSDFAVYIQALNLKYFKPYEFLIMGHQNANPHSRAYGLNTKPPRKHWDRIGPTANVLDALRSLMGAPISFLSVYRNEAYNVAIGGAKFSQHMNFDAVDFVVKSNSGPADWATALRTLRQQGLFKGGIGTYGSFVHVDTRGSNVDW